MSHNYYRSSQDMYQTRSTSASGEPPHPSASGRSVDIPVCLPGNVLTFLQSCGLESTDLTQLAKLPEDVITVDALPDLLLRIREQKLSSTLSSRPTTSLKLDDSTSCNREEARHLKLTKYPLDVSARSAFPLPRDQIQSWQDRWGNPRKTGSSVSSGESSRVLDCPRRDNGEQYYSKQVYSSAVSDSSSTDSHSYSNADRYPRPLLSLAIEPIYKTPTRKEASDFWGKVPPVFPYACILCNITALSEGDWIIHINGTLHANSQLKLLQKYPRWDQTVESTRRNENLTAFHSFSNTGGFRVPTKRESSAFQGRIPLAFPHLCVLCDFTVLSEKEWSLHISGALHAKSQFKLLEKYPDWNQSFESARNSDSDDRRESYSSRNDSPSPKRRRSSDKTYSSNGHRFKEKDYSRHSKERSSTKNSSLHSYSATKHEVNGKTACSSRSLGEDGSLKKSSRSSSTPATWELRKSSRSLSSLATRESRKSSRSSSSLARRESKKSAQDSESDLEGMEVIADDGQELQLECKEQDPGKEQDPEKEQDPGKEQDPEKEQELAEVPNEENDVDSPETFTNCITLDELLEEPYLDWQDELIVSKTTEEALTEVTTSPATTTNSEQSHKQSELPNENTIDAETRSSEDAQEQEIKTFMNGIRETFGKVLEVRNLPKEEHYTDLDLIKIITRYGKVIHHVLFRSHKKGFIEMENVCDAQRVAADADKQDVALRGNVLIITVSKKYSSLLAESLSPESADEENTQNQSDASSGNIKSEPSSDAALNQPVGTEFVRPVVGYFCHLCNVIYASEEEAKDEHCRTPAHHEKVKEHKARNGSV